MKKRIYAYSNTLDGAKLQLQQKRAHIEQQGQVTFDEVKEFGSSAIGYECVQHYTSTDKE